MSVVSRISHVSCPRTRTVLSINTLVRNKATVASTSYSPDVAMKECMVAKPFDDIPGPTGIYNLPFLGFLFHLKPFTNYTIRNMNWILDDMVNKYGPIFKMRTDSLSVMLSDPEDFASVFRQEGQYPIRPNFDILNVYSKRTGFPTDLGGLQGEPWWRLKLPTHKAMMKSHIMHGSLPQMNEASDDFVKVMTRDDFNDKDLGETYMAYTAESAGLVLFNRRLGFLDENPPKETKTFLDATITVLLILQNTGLGASTMYKFFKTKEYLKFEEARNVVKFTIQKHVKNAYDDLMKKKRTGTFDPAKPTVLSSLIDTCTLDDATLILEALYMAAVDSSASTIQAIFHVLATHPQKQEKLRKEIHEVLGLHNQLTAEHLEHMPYLKAVIKENYRCNFPLPIGTYRKLLSDIVIKGYKIPAMTQIYFLNAQACQNYFDEPEKFLPERWLRDKNAPINVDDQTRRRAVLPFGSGKRSCSGKKLFEQELYLILARTLQKLHIGLHEESKNMKFEYGLFLKPVDPLQFKFTNLDPHSGHVPRSVVGF